MKILVGLLAVATFAAAHPKLVSKNKDFFFFRGPEKSSFSLMINFQEGEGPSNSFWKDTKIDGIVKSLQTECDHRNDVLSCMKYKVLRFLDQVLSSDSFQVG